MIKSIRLLNWRSHADSKLEFRKGTNLLVGMMGAGKSSVLEAISFAFFGTFPALERRKLKLEDIVRLSENKTKVILEFEWDEENYRIERSIERSKKGAGSEAELFKNNSSIEHGPVAVTSCIQNLTGVDYDLFTRAIYSEQNNIDYFLNLDPRKRKQELDALLGLDKFEEARANVVSVIGRMRSKKQGIEERFNKTRLAELKQKEKIHLEETTNLEKRLKSVAVVYEEEQKKLNSISSNFEELKKKKDKFETLEKEKIRLSTEFHSLKKDIGVADEKAYAQAKTNLQAFSDERSKLNLSLKSLDHHHLSLSKEAGSIDAKLKTAALTTARLKDMKEEQIKLLEGHTPEWFVNEQKETEKIVLSANSDLKSLEHNITEISELMVKLKPGLSECPLCATKITDASLEHIISEKNSLIKQKKAKITEIAKLLAERKKQNDELIVKVRKITLLSEKITTLEQESIGAEQFENRKSELIVLITKILNEKKSIEGQIESLGNKIEKLHIEVNNYETILRKKKELELTEKKLSDVENQLKSIHFDLKELESLREKLELSRITVERLVSDKRAVDTELRMSSDLLKLVREELFQLTQMEKELILLSRLEEELSIYKNALLDTQTTLRGSLIDAINTAMNEIWPIFYPYRNYHALRLEVTEKDYLFEVNDSREWKGLESIASGGERASAALTLRVALAMVLTPKLSWLILDEPTHNLDQEAVELLSSALQFKVPEVVKQTFVITHEEGLMGSDFASSYRLRRDKERNTETKIEII